jgi:hypothetical protein
MATKKTTKPQPVVAPAPAPKVDPIRTRTYGMSPEAEAEVRNALLAMILDWAHEAPAHKLQDIAAFMEILDNNTGCTSPAEEFIATLVSHHVIYGDAITPDIVANKLTEFRDDFESAIAVARRVAGQYPNVLLSAAE